MVTDQPKWNRERVKGITKEKGEGEMQKNSKGITLITLVVTLIVLLILAGVSIVVLMENNGILSSASESKIKTELGNYLEQLNLYKSQKRIDNLDFVETSLTAGKTTLSYNTQDSEEEGNIKTIIPTISDKYFEKIEVFKGKLCINTQNERELKVAQSLGLDVNPYEIEGDGVLVSSNGNLLLMDKETGTLTIPDSIKEIGEGAFQNLEGLKTIIIPGSVKKIGLNAFASNKDLETVIMQEGVEEIGTNAFRNCNKLKNVQMPNTLRIIGSEAFYHNLELESIEIPSNVKSLGNYSFAECIKLKEIILQEGLNTIATEAFSSTAIKEIYIPITVEVIGEKVFTNCKNLDNVICGSSKYIYESGILMDAEKTNILFISSSYLSQITTLKIPEGIQKFTTSIATYTNIIKVEIPNSLTSFSSGILPATISDIMVATDNENFVSENGMFYEKGTNELFYCYSKDTTIDVPEGIKVLKAYSFYLATNAEVINLPDSLTIIEDQVFTNCKSVKEINIGPNVKEINSIFKYLNYSGVVKIDASNPYYLVDNNILYKRKNESPNEEKILIAVLYQIEGVFKITDETVVEIADLSFHYQYAMTNIELGPNVKIIGNSFNFCYGLTSIEIPNNVESIGTRCFLNCDNLKLVEIDKAKDSIANAPFKVPAGMKAIIWKR